MKGLRRSVVVLAAIVSLQRPASAGWVSRGDAPIPARRDHSMAYDSSRSVVVVFGGFTFTSPPYVNDTWEYDGTSWYLRLSNGPMSPRADAAMAFDARRDRLVLTGGSNGHNAFAETYELGATGGWQQDGAVPAALGGHAGSAAAS